MSTLDSIQMRLDSAFDEIDPHFSGRPVFTIETIAVHVLRCDRAPILTGVHDDTARRLWDRTVIAIDRPGLCDDQALSLLAAAFLDGPTLLEAARAGQPVPSKTFHRLDAFVDQLRGRVPVVETEPADFKGSRHVVSIDGQRVGVLALADGRRLSALPRMTENAVRDVIQLLDALRPLQSVKVGKLIADHEDAEPLRKAGPFRPQERWGVTDYLNDQGVSAAECLLKPGKGQHVLHQDPAARHDVRRNRIRVAPWETGVRFLAPPDVVAHFEMLCKVRGKLPGELLSELVQ